MRGRIITSDHRIFELPVLLRWNITYTGGVPCDSYEVTCVYDRTMAELLHLAAGFLALDENGGVLLRGIVDEYEVKLTAAGLTVTICGRGYAARLLDNESRPVTYQGATLAEIVRCHAAPYGISSAEIAPVSADSVYTVAAGTSQWKALEGFCRTYGGFSPRFRRDGLLVAAHSPHTQAQHAALLGELPCVYLGSNHGPGCSYVEVDNEQGAYQATQYLYRLGHRRIVFLGGRQDSRTLEQRLQGYRRSMLANHLIPDAAAAPDGTENLGAWCFQEARRLFRQSPCPDAVIAYSDILAMQVMEAAEECGLHAPEDFSVIGFDDIALGRLPHIHLTTVSQRETQAGELAIRRLLEKIDGSAAVTEDILEPELVIRSTCRRI